MVGNFIINTLNISICLNSGENGYELNTQHLALRLLGRLLANGDVKGGKKEVDQVRILITGSFHRKVNLKSSQNEIGFDRLWYPLSILLLAAIGAKLIGPHGGLQVDK